MVVIKVVKLKYMKKKLNIRIIGGYQDTRPNKEDIALTPYLFGVYVNGEILKVRGIGLCWLYYSVYIGFGLNIPKGASGFINLTKK